MIGFGARNGVVQQAALSIGYVLSEYRGIVALCHDTIFCAGNVILDVRFSYVLNGQCHIMLRSDSVLHDIALPGSCSFLFTVVYNSTLVPN